MVLPIFYKVDPSEVRKQSGKFGEEFAKLEVRFSSEKMQAWREAMISVSHMSGWPVPKKEYFPFPYIYFHSFALHILFLLYTSNYPKVRACWTEGKCKENVTFKFGSITSLFSSFSFLKFI